MVAVCPRSWISIDPIDHGPPRADGRGREKPGPRDPRHTGGRRAVSSRHEEARMPRYMVERTFKGGLEIPVNAEGAKVCMAVVGTNAGDGVTWVHSYVSEDKTK